MNRMVIATIVLYSLAGCNNTDNANQSTATEFASARSLDVTGSAGLVPRHANDADRALMRLWLDQNEHCRGSSDAATIASMCPKRDYSEIQLKRRGWCWSYDDWTVVPADFRWHRCSEKTLADNDRSVPRSEIEIPPIANGIQSGVHYPDIWSEMKYNPSSPALGSYIKAAEPIDQKIGNAGALLKCGIQNVAWYGEVIGRLEAYRAGENVRPLFAQLTAEEKSQARKFDRVVVQGQMEFSGGHFSKQDCETLAQAPFVRSDAAFAP